MERRLARHPPRWRDRFKKVATAAKTERDKRDELSDDRLYNRELDKLYPVANNGDGSAHESIFSIGARVVVIRAWRGFNSRFIGRVGYVIERHPVGSTFDVAVKFVSKKNPDMDTIRELPGSIGDFRGGELERI